MTSENDVDIAAAFAEFRDVVDRPDVGSQIRVNEYNKVAAFYDQVSDCKIFFVN